MSESDEMNNDGNNSMKIEIPYETTNLMMKSGACRIAQVHDRVYNSECVYTFHSPWTSLEGIVVSLSSFIGTVLEMAFCGGAAAAPQQDKEGLFVRIVKQRLSLPSSAEGTTLEPTKLGIGIEGGFARQEDKYEIITNFSVMHLKMGPTKHSSIVVCEIPYTEQTKKDFPLIITQSVDSILNHAGSSLQQDVQVWQLDQNENDIPVSKYAANLPFVDNGVTINPDPNTWKCQKRGDTDNLWLNLSDGYIGGGRQQWDGSGGSNGAIDHFHETGQLYPLVVKLGTITADIQTADCYSYAHDEDGPVRIPNLALLLQKRGIHVANLQKTVKSTAELEVELNANYAFDAITENSSKLKPVSGPFLQGLHNLGNSCYMNSVLQLLFHIPEFAARYGIPKTSDKGDKITAHQVFDTVSPTQAPDHVLCQTVKLAMALTSGAYARPLPSDSDQQDEDLDNPKYRLAPRMFKHVIGKDHVDFRTGQQQDAAQFLQYFLEKLDRAEKGTGVHDPPPSHVLSFALETRSVCAADHKVKYSNNKGSTTPGSPQQCETIWSIPIPMELAVLPDASSDGAPPEQKRLKPASAAGVTSATSNDEGSNSTATTADTAEEEASPLVPQIDLMTCLARWAAETTVDDVKWPHLGGASHAAMVTTRLTNFPRYLLLQLNRYTLGPDWQSVKLQVELQIPHDDQDDTKYVINLAKYKLFGGRPPQPNEVLVPSEEELAAAAAASASVIDEAALAQLMDMGFSLNSCQRALLAVGGSDVEAAMGWVFEHNNDPDFNDPLPANLSSSSVQSGVDEGTVQTLVEMLGCFTSDQARFALQQTNNSTERAADWLFSHMDELDTLMNASSSTNTSNNNKSAATETTQLEDSNDCSLYQLMGMISHIGKSTSSGHYVAHLLHGNKWIIFNDEKVAESSKPPVEHAYLYLFQRTDTLSGQ